MEHKRNCPDCGKKLTYNHISNYWRAVANKSVCANCRKMPESMKQKASVLFKGKKNPNYKRRKNPPVNFIKECPGCGDEMKYVKEYSYKEAIKKKTRCRSCIMKDRIKEKGSAYILTEDQIKKMAATKAGYKTWEDYQNSITEWKKYKNKVTSITNKQPLHELKNYDKKGRMGEKDAYNIDHIYSIHKGFMNGIDPTIIGDFKNLRIIPWLENIKKHKN